MEVNFIPGFEKTANGRLLHLGFEFEYVLFKNFGVELEPTYIFSSTNNSSGLGDIEIETQYTLLHNERMGLAGGIEFGIPIGDEEKGFGEGAFELEPFFTYVLKSPIGLSFHPRISTEIEPGEAYEMVVNYNLGLLYTIGDFFLGAELAGVTENDPLTSIAPQMGVELGDLFLGAGIKIPTGKTANNSDYQGIIRMIYEFKVEQ